MNCPRQILKANPDSPFHRNGFTLIELMIVIGIICLLAALLFFVGRQVQQKAYAVKCLSRMKNLHDALQAHMQDHEGVWPQVDLELEGEDYWKSWYDTLQPYKVTPVDWLCPSEETTLKKEENRPKYDSSYSITHFDDNPNTAFLWPQPWILERGDFHGSGARMMMPDGSVQDAPFTGSFGER